jgi:hypothetical protein
MTVTLGDVPAKKRSVPSPEAEAARELVRLAKEQGLSLTGPDGLLKQFTDVIDATTTAGAVKTPRGLGYNDSATCSRMSPGGSTPEMNAATRPGSPTRTHPLDTCSSATRRWNCSVN